MGATWGTGPRGCATFAVSSRLPRLPTSKLARESAGRTGVMRGLLAAASTGERSVVQVASILRSLLRWSGEVAGGGSLGDKKLGRNNSRLGGRTRFSRGPLRGV